MELTPIQSVKTSVGLLHFKRDDLFEIAGVKGGKVRTCYELAKNSKVGLTTAGSRSSPQVNIVANVAKYLGLPCVAHLPEGKLNKEIELAQATGCQIFQHKAGYNSVIVARSRQFALNTGFTDIPFGMECQEAVKQTSMQVENIPEYINRIVIPVGAGMSCAGVLHGLADCERRDIQVLGIVVGADPTKRLFSYAPLGFQEQLKLVPAGVDYSKYVVPDLELPFTLDPVYEAKCVKFMKPGDLLWCVGIRQSIT